MKSLLGAVIIGFVAETGTAEIAISNVEVFSGYPWKEVAIGYTITGNTVCSSDLLEAMAIDNQSGRTYVCSTLKGVDLSPGSHVIQWDATADGAKFQSASVIFKLAIATQYCVIDLSGGSSAVRYPVMGLTDMPSGGWTDEYKTTKLVLRRLDAGTFHHDGFNGDTTLTKPFYIGVFEVTQKQWELVMGWDLGATEGIHGKGPDYPAHFVSYGEIRGRSDTVGALWPKSSAVDANSFLGKLRARTGLDFDLPTEAQWEYACRAGTKTKYYWGDSMNGDCAWYSNNAGSQTHPVGTKEANAWGLYDMIGNVSEWCLDWAGAIGDGIDPKGPETGTTRVLRGGGWYDQSAQCTSSSRSNEHPGNLSTKISHGFRLARILLK